MKKLYFHILCGLLLIFVFEGCSRKKDNFISRNWHAVGTEYNVLYNGNIALESGRQSLIEGYTDNYWEILPIERMQILEDVSLPGQAKNADFERAEEKAVKAIQKHSMNILGKEKNPQIDEAYLLLGKARYFDQRFVPALEAFNYILFKYPASDKINQAKIWREKTNLRLENDELAIQNLERLLRQADIRKQDLADAASTLAQAYMNKKVLDTAITYLDMAAAATRKNEEKGRYRFIQGQLYNALDKRDSANMAFNQVIDLHRKTARIYYISAHIEKAKNFDYDSGNKLEFLEMLTELEENRENRPYLDKIYHQIAEFHLNNGSDSIAVDYYNKSLRTNSRDKLLNARNYLVLGDMNFDNAVYRIAGAYYDSTLLNLETNTKLFRSIKRKRDNLDDVIYYEDVAIRNDSIINLVEMDEEERLAFFKAYTDGLREKAEREKALREAEERKFQGIAGSSKNDPNQIGPKDEKSGSFYFYNSTTVAFGINEFIQVWGERKLEDNWRWSDRSRAGGSSREADPVIAAATDEERYDPQFYIDLIPVEETAIDSLVRDRNFAYYQLGLIYKEKFREYELSREKLRTLLDNKPEDRLILPAKYNLLKVYEALSQKDEAEIMKADIINNHPDSRYAIILLNPDVILEADENSPEIIYEGLYRKYESQNYSEVIEECDKYINMFDGEAIVPKFEFLKAVSKARLMGFEAYKEAINYIALNYPNSPEGKKAEEIVQKSIPLLERTEFYDDSNTNSFKVVYTFKSPSKEELEDFKAELDDAVERVKYLELKTSVDRYDSETIFVVVHNLKSFEGAQGFGEILNEYEKNNINRPYLSISSANYQIVQIHKNLDTYLKSE